MQEIEMLYPLPSLQKLVCLELCSKITNKLAGKPDPGSVNERVFQAYHRHCSLLGMCLLCDASLGILIAIAGWMLWPNSILGTALYVPAMLASLAAHATFVLARASRRIRKVIAPSIVEMAREQMSMPCYKDEARLSQMLADYLRADPLLMVATQCWREAGEALDALYCKFRDKPDCEEMELYRTLIEEHRAYHGFLIAIEQEGLWNLKVHAAIARNDLEAIEALVKTGPPTSEGKRIELLF